MDEEHQFMYYDMEKPNHTPGPWKIDPFAEMTDEIAAIITDVNDVQVARVKHLHTKKEIANARLIAAAPELLFQVQQAKTILEVIDPENPAIQQIEKVIKKATNGKN